MKMYYFGYKSKFFYLLSSLIIYFIASSLLTKATFANIFLSCIFSLVILFCIYSISKTKLLIYFILVLGILTLINHWLDYIYPLSITYSFLYYIEIIIFLTLITYSDIYLVTKHQQISSDTLCGAICGYLLVGFTWTFIYTLIDLMNPTAFSNHPLGPSMHERTQFFLYYSFTTLTTLGFGDILPLHNVSRTFSWLETVAGQIYLAVWISQLVGLRISQKR